MCPRSRYHWQPGGFCTQYAGIEVADQLGASLLTALSRSAGPLCILRNFIERIVGFWMARVVAVSEFAEMATSNILCKGYSYGADAAGTPLLGVIWRAQKKQLTTLWGICINRNSHRRNSQALTLNLCARKSQSINLISSLMRPSIVTNIKLGFRLIASVTILRCTRYNNLHSSMFLR